MSVPILLNADVVLGHSDAPTVHSVFFVNNVFRLSNVDTLAGVAMPARVPEFNNI